MFIRSRGVLGERESVEARAEEQSSKAREAAEDKVGTWGSNWRTTEQVPCPLQSSHGPYPPQGCGPTSHAQMGATAAVGFPHLARRLAALRHARPCPWPGLLIIITLNDGQWRPPISAYTWYTYWGGNTWWGNGWDSSYMYPTSSLHSNQKSFRWVCLGMYSVWVQEDWRCHH